MPFVINTETDGDHQWSVASCVCNLADDSDPLLQASAKLAQEAYGEDELIAATDNILAGIDPLVAETFDMEAIIKGFRLGLPDPSVENATGKKPWLRNYRSESTELVARGVLKKAHGIEFPTHPQLGKANSNQPFLGFDGWGLLAPITEDADHKLVLVQVKGTDDKSCPPAEAHKLAKECKEVPRDISKLSRTLAILVTRLQDTPHGIVLLDMLQDLGQGILPSMAVAPVVVRGVTPPAVGDLQPIKDAVDDFVPACARGIVVAISAPLTEFGERVMKLARAA